MTRNFAEPLQQIDRTFVLWRGRKLVYFAGCDYLRLSSHPAIHRAIKSTLAQFGLNVSASRKTTGNHLLYEELEKETARFFGAPAALLTSSGYLTNLSVAEGLHGSVSAALIDQRAHGSLHQAAAMLGCPVYPLKHRNPAALQPVLSQIQNKRKIVLLTDGIFAFDGSPAPLRAWRETLGPDALMWIDDSHAAGVIGKQGRGSVEFHKLSRRNVIQTITFSKAFGSYGGAILCSHPHARLITSKSAAITGNTPLPLPLVGASLAALKFLREFEHLQKLHERVQLFWDVLGQPAPHPLSPIIALSPAKPLAVKTALLNRGIFPSLISYPGASGNRYFRFALSCEHTPAQITALAEAVRPYWPLSATMERHGSS